MPTITVNPGENLQSKIDVNPAGSRFILKSGIHRGQSVNPKAGTIFELESNAEVSGGQIITSWTLESGRYYFDIDLPITDKNVIGAYSVATTENPRAGWNIALFHDQAPVKHVATIGDVVSVDQYFYDNIAKRLWIYNPAAFQWEVTTETFFINSSNSNITVIGGVIRNYRPPIQNGAIQADFAAFLTLQDVTLINNTGNGANGGSNAVFSGCSFVSNGMQGFGVRGSNPLIENCDVRDNNFLGTTLDFSAAGSKISNSDGAIVRNSRFKDNDGVGLWFDVNNINGRVENCQIVGNTRHGGYSEVGCSVQWVDNWIGFNVPAGNPGVTGAQLRVANARNNTIQGNHIVAQRPDNSTGESCGIGLTQTSRGSGSGACSGEWLTVAALVEDNDIYLLSGANKQPLAFGGYASYQSLNFFNSQSNLFQGNRVHIEGAATPASVGVYVWANSGSSSTGGAKTLAQLQANTVHGDGDSVDSAVTTGDKTIPGWDSGAPDPGSEYLTRILGIMNPIIHYAIDESSGTQMTDYSGNNAHGIYGSVGLGVAGIGDGKTSGQWTRTASYGDMRSSFLNATFNPNRFGLYGWFNFASGDITDGNQHYIFRLDATNLLTMARKETNNLLTLYHSINGTVTKQTTIAITEGWHSLMMHFDHDQDELRWFLDGDLVYEQKSQGLPAVSSFSSFLRNTLGAYSNNGTSGATAKFAHFGIRLDPFDPYEVEQFNVIVPEPSAPDVNSMLLLSLPAVMRIGV